MPQFMTENNTITLEPGVVSLAQLRDFYINHCPFKLHPDAWNDINKSAAAVQNIVDKGSAAYGINTGFGLLAKTRVENDQLGVLQRNLVLSHCTGVGQLIDHAVVRLIIILKII